MSGIIIKDLTKTYNGHGGIRNVTLNIPDGKLTAIVGPSGCGKTTLLRTIAGFFYPQSGSISFGNRDVTFAKPQNRNASMVFQQYALWSHMSVYDNIAYGLKLKKEKDIESKVIDILNRVEIETSDIKKRKPQNYSGGQQQRIALARSLVIQPDVLLMDEPLSNLDAKVRQRLRLEIKKIQENFGITTVYVTHDQEEALSMADFIVIMNAGNIVQSGTPREVYQSPNSRFVGTFLGESHTLDLNLDGKEESFIVRAEDIKLIKSSQDYSNDSVDGVFLDAKVISHLYMGSYQRYMVVINDKELFADSDDMYEDGENCKVFIAKNKLLGFESETE